MAATFAILLKKCREEAGISQRALARATNINPAIISRLETGDRGPSGPAQVIAIVRALKLDSYSADALLASAGLWPEAITTLGAGDETLLAVARVLSDRRLSEESRQRFRQIVDLLVEEWAAAATTRSGESTAN